MPDDDRVIGAMRAALSLAVLSKAPRNLNPRVGCVILAADGEIVGRGFTGASAGAPHAEVAALADAGRRASGGTAVVTLEPCRHVGRTGPCTSALVEAGIARVVFAQSDPTAEAGGGAQVLAEAGVQTSGGLLADEAERINLAWTFFARCGRPLVTWKCATSLDGRVAGPDGGPTPITGTQSRRLVHLLRADVDAIIVGTGTVLADDPALTVRLADGDHSNPLRVVVGSRHIPQEARVLDDAAETVVVDERDPTRLLEALATRGVRHALLEGGPTLAAAFLNARVIDRVDWFVAPMLLGAGPVALPGTAGGQGVDVDGVSVVGEDVRIQGWIRHDRAGTD